MIQKYKYNKMEKNQNHIYSLKVTERQAKLLSWACDTIARLIEGQDFFYQQLFETAWKNAAKKRQVDLWTMSLKEVGKT